VFAPFGLVRWINLRRFDSDHKWYVGSAKVPDRNLRTGASMQDLDLKSLRLLVAVCDHGNIKQAAAQDHIEPSAISKRIAQLEHALGTPLLVRGRRGVVPTPACQAVLEHARSLPFTLERLDADAGAFAGGIKG